MSIDHGLHCTYDDRCTEETEPGEELCWAHRELIETPDPDSFVDQKRDDSLGVL